MHAGIVKEKPPRASCYPGFCVPNPTHSHQYGDPRGPAARASFPRSHAVALGDNLHALQVYIVLRKPTRSPCRAVPGGRAPIHSMHLVSILAVGCLLAICGGHTALATSSRGHVHGGDVSYDTHGTNAHANMWLPVRLRGAETAECPSREERNVGTLGRAIEFILCVPTARLGAVARYRLCGNAIAPHERRCS